MPSDPVPRVSVLMPVFNVAPYLSEAIRSILDQSFVDFELIVIDDGSTDASFRILEGFARSDKRIRLSSRANRGLVATLNEMIGMARGEYFARMDGDDIAFPQRFARQVEFLDTHPQLVAAGSRALFIDAEGLPLMEVIPGPSHEEIQLALMRPELGIVHPSVMMRASACRAIGGYRDEYPHAEDLDFFLRLGELGRLENLQTVLLKYRNHQESVSARFVDAQWRSANSAVRAALVRRKMNPATRADSLKTGPRVETPSETHRKWSWWAISAGYLPTARKHARLALMKNPFDVANYKLLACAIRDSLKRLR